MSRTVQIVALTCVGLVYQIAGIFIGRKLYTMTKNEKHQERGKVIQRIMTTYAFVQCLVWPLFTMTAWLLYLNKNALNLVGPFITGYMIIASRFLYVWFRFYIGFNSLIIALCRYCFIVKNSFVSHIGVGRIRKVFFTSSVAIPALLALSNEALLPVEISWICMFMPSHNETEVKRNSSDVFCTKDIMADISESPLFNLLHDNMSPSMTFGLQIFHKIVLAIAMSNILEGILYILTFVFITRYFIRLYKM